MSHIMPSDLSFQPSPDPEHLLAVAHRVFSKKDLAAKLDIDRKTLTRWEKQPERLPVARQLALKEILRTAPRLETTESDFTFIDLFAGIGGIHAGFKTVNGRCVFTSE